MVSFHARAAGAAKTADALTLTSAAAILKTGARG